MTLEQVFSYEPYPGEKERLVNQILNTIAEGSGKLRVFTSYTFRTDVNLAVRREGEQEYSLTATVEDTDLRGDVYYQDFSLRELLVPGKADFNLEIFNQHGQKVFDKAFYALDLPVPGKRWFRVSFSVDQPVDSMEMTLHNPTFYYDEEMHNKMLAWGEALETYYEASAQLSRLDSLLMDMDPADPETLLPDEFSLCEAEYVMGEIQHAPFHRWLDLRQHDPEDVVSRFEAQESTMDTLRNAFNLGLTKLDSLYYDRGMLHVNDSLFDDARKAFLSAVNFNPFHIPSHLAIARLDMQQDYKEASLERLANVWSVMHPAEDIESEAHAVTKNVITLVFDESLELILDTRYSQSLSLLEYVQRFCREVESYYNCPYMLERRLNQSHYGMFHSFLVVSERALRNDMLDTATEYIQSALDYHDQHEAYINAKVEAYDLLFSVFTRQRILSEIFMMADNGLGYDPYLQGATSMAAAFPDLFHYILEKGNLEQIRTAVLNYAATGMPQQSIDLLKELKDKGIAASETAYLQRKAAESAAGFNHPPASPYKKPGDLVRDMDLDGPWFQIFVDSLRKYW
ncbi:MAG: hypothetical protein R6U62_02370 [Bacteroidales bacterium]